MDTQTIGIFAGGVIGFLCFVLYLEHKKRKDPQQLRREAARASTKAEASRWKESFRQTHVLVGGDAVHVVRANGYTETLQLAHLSSASLVTAFYSGACLHEVELRGGRTVSVSQLADGFDAFVHRMELLPGYDHEAFQAGLRDTARQRRILFRARLPVSARLHSSASLSLLEAIDSGFLLGGGDERLSLDDTIEQLGQKRGTTYLEDAYGYGQLHTGSIVIGDLELSGLNILLSSGLANRPLRSLQGELVLAADGTSYWSVKRYLQMCLGEGQGGEAGTQLHWRWIVDGLQFAISYLRDSETTVESGACNFTIDNLRKYPQYLLDDSRNDVDLRQVQALVLPVEASGPTRDFSQMYLGEANSASHPVAAGSRRKSVVWNDRKHRKIGFARGEDALIVPYDQVGTIRMLNTLPAKGGGSSDLRVAERSTQDDRWSGHVAVSAGTGELPKWKSRLEEILSMPIVREEDDYDV